MHQWWSLSWAPKAVSWKYQPPVITTITWRIENPTIKTKEKVQTKSKFFYKKTHHSTKIRNFAKTSGKNYNSGKISGETLDGSLCPLGHAKLEARVPAELWPLGHAKIWYLHAFKISKNPHNSILVCNILT